MMLGAIAGDVVGSAYEWHSTKKYGFELFTSRSRFTDDSVLTIAVADAILNDEPYGEALRRWGRRYPDAGYGGRFRQWLVSGDPHPYNSLGNGSAMRVSPVGWAFDGLEDVLREAERSAEPTHNHPEGILGARTVARAILLARNGASKEDIRLDLEAFSGYDLSRRLEDIRSKYSFDVTCRGSVPEAIIAFLESGGYEDAIRRAVSLGGDADTQACIAGGIAEAFYGMVPEHIIEEVLQRLPDDMRRVLLEFRFHYGIGA